MKKQITYILLLFAALWSSVQRTSAQIYDAQGQYVDTVFHDHINRQAEDFVTVSFVACDPCDILYSTLGHACLHLECPTFHLDYFFTYESENLRDKVWTFLRGKLKMGMFAYTKNEFLRDYKEAGRGVREYKLNLSPEQKQRLWQVMDEKVAQGPNLPYDYFHKGCAKSVVGVVKEALGDDAIHYAPWPDKYTKQTQREIVRNYIENAPWSEFEMYFLIGTDGDKDYPCEQKLIVPADLVEVWQKATLDGHPLLDTKAQELLPSVPQKKASWFTPLLASCLLLLLVILGWLFHQPYADWLLLSLQTLIGLVMTYLICFSNLPCTNWNWLIIPFNPLPAIVWAMNKWKPGKWYAYCTLSYAVILAIWEAAMLLYPHVLVDWSHLVIVLAIIIMLAKQTFSKRSRL